MRTHLHTARIVDYARMLQDRWYYCKSSLMTINLINCRIHHVTVPIATRILIANVRQIGLSNVCVINFVYFKMQV